jgi:hypothetical protein
VILASKSGKAWGFSISAPLTVATFFVVYSWASNLGNQIPLIDVAIVLVSVWLASLACLLICWLIYRKAERAALGAIVLVVLLLTFGHVVRMAHAHPDTAGMRLLLVAYVLLAVAGLVVVARVRFPERLPSAVALIAGAFVLANLIRITASGAAIDTSGDLPRAGDRVSIPGLQRPQEGGRDVYYLIFDRYANERVLEQSYGFSNALFLDTLESRGFTITHDAVANYPGTAHSLASSLNLTYLDDLAARVGPDSNDWRPLFQSLTDSVAMRAFDRLGYRTVHVGSWWSPTWIDPSADVNYVYPNISEFPAAFLSTTVFPYIGDEIGVMESSDEWRDQYRRVSFQVRAILEIAKDPEPTFTFAHFTLPHGPYIFTAEGRFVPGVQPPTAQAYIEQLRYTNSVIDELTSKLVGGPEGAEPIVILQSDEGPHPIHLDADPDPEIDWPLQPQRELERKMRIFSAYYLPGPESGRVQPTKTPVNTFRVILDRYFGAHLPILGDQAFVYERHDLPYSFRNVSTRLRIRGS